MAKLDRIYYVETSEFSPPFWITGIDDMVFPVREAVVMWYMNSLVSIGEGAMEQPRSCKQSWLPMDMHPSLLFIALEGVGMRQL